MPTAEQGRPSSPSDMKSVMLETSTPLGGVAGDGIVVDGPARKSMPLKKFLFVPKKRLRTHVLYKQGNRKTTSNYKTRMTQAEIDDFLQSVAIARALEQQKKV